MPNIPSAASIKVQVPGSGTAALIDTPSSNEKGGTPEGVPTAKKDNTALELVAVKLKVSCIQPLKPCEVF